MRCRWCNRTIIFVEAYPEDYWSHIDGHIRCFDRGEMPMYAEPPAEKHRFKIIMRCGHGWVKYRCTRCGRIIMVNATTLWLGKYGRVVLDQMVCKGGKSWLK